MSKAGHSADSVVGLGERGFTNMPVTTRLDGSQLSVVAHVIRGLHDGPTLTVVSGLHGSEWFAVEMLRRFVRDIEPAAMHGTVVVIPVANPMAFEHFSRMTPDESDEPDLNRVFPGGDTWVAEQIAKVLTNEVLSRTDVLVDIHTGPWGSALDSVSYGADLPNQEVTQKSYDLAVAFGSRTVRGLKVIAEFPGPRSITGYAGAILGIPAIGPNVGGSGFAATLEEEWIAANVRGLRNVMAHLGMVEGSVCASQRMFHFVTRGLRVVPRAGGLLEPAVEPEALGTEVHAGDLLGRVISPYTFDLVEELRAPAAGVLFGVCRQYPVRPGDWAFFVAPADADGSHWLEPETATTDA